MLKHLLSRARRRLCGAVPAEILLREWCRQSKSLVARDYHLFRAAALSEADDHFYFVHAPSGGCARISATVASLVRLLLAPEGEREDLIAMLAERGSRQDLILALEMYVRLLARVESQQTPPPSSVEPVPKSGELLMFGNLTCNMACPYCLSREARAEALAGQVPRLMPLETAYQSIRFIAERMAGQAEHVYVNFTLGGEPLLSMERYQVSVQRT